MKANKANKAKFSLPCRAGWTKLLEASADEHHPSIRWLGAAFVAAFQ